MLKKTTAVLLLSLAALVIPRAPAAAEEAAWPTAKAIRFVVPAPPGGPPDLIARALADELQRSLHQAIVVENRVGGGHIIGSEAVARSAPDGYTYLVVSTPHVVNPALHDKLPYDTQRDFAPVSWLTSLPLVLVVNADLPVKTVADLVDLARAKPGQLNMASAGNGGGPHLAGELLILATGISVAHIPYNGPSQAIMAVMRNEASFYFDTPSGSLQLIASGKLRGLAVTSPKRAAMAPDIPTMAEAGFPGVDFDVWNGIVTVAGTPRDIVDRMSAAIGKALATSDITSRFAAMGIETVGSTPEQLGALIDRDIDRWRAVVKKSGMTAD